MVNALRMTLVLIGLLPHAIAQADDSESPDWSAATAAASANAAVLNTVTTSPSMTELPAGIDSLDFRDSSAFGRASRLRSLSLLTLAEFRQSRLFLGVNQRGVLGLHLNAAAKGDDRCLEVARMPWLRNDTSE